MLTVVMNNGLLSINHEKTWRTLKDHEMQDTLGSNSISRFGHGLKQAGLSGLAALVMNEPHGCRPLNFTAILGEYTDTPR